VLLRPRLALLPPRAAVLPARVPLQLLFSEQRVHCFRVAAAFLVRYVTPACWASQVTILAADEASCTMTANGGLEYGALCYDVNGCCPVGAAAHTTKSRLGEDSSSAA
jgi:hypothetical protein